MIQENSDNLHNNSSLCALNDWLVITKESHDKYYIVDYRRNIKPNK